MYTKAQDTEQLVSSENQQDNKDYLIERNQIENTPFWLIGNEEIKYHLVLGKHRLTSETIEKKIQNNILKIISIQLLSK